MRRECASSVGSVLLAPNAFVRSRALLELRNALRKRVTSRVRYMQLIRGCKRDEKGVMQRTNRRQRSPITYFVNRQVRFARVFGSKTRPNPN